MLKRTQGTGKIKTNENDEMRQEPENSSIPDNLF